MEIIQTKKAPAAVGPYCQGVSSQGKKTNFHIRTIATMPRKWRISYIFN